MKLQQLLIRHADNLETVYKTISEYYDEFGLDYDTFKDIYDTLLDKDPKECETPLEIIIKKDKSLEDDITYYDVYARDPNDMSHLGQISLSLTDWDEWLALPVNTYTYMQFSEPEIIAHCLWEMTWYGLESDMQQTREEIQDRLDKIKSGEFNPIVIPIDEFLDALESGDIQDILEAYRDEDSYYDDDNNDEDL